MRATLRARDAWWQGNDRWRDPRCSGHCNAKPIPTLIAPVLQYGQACHCRKGKIMLRWTCIGATFIVSVLIVGTFGCGVAIQQRVIAPPELDLQVGGFRLVA